MNANFFLYVILILFNSTYKTSGNSRKGICFCMDENGVILMIENKDWLEISDSSGASPSVRYAFPEFTYVPSASVQRQIRDTLHRYSIRGKAGGKMLYMPGNERRGHSFFYRIYVREYPDTQQEGTILTDAKSATRLLENHPNHDYTAFMNRIMQHPSSLGFKLKGELLVPNEHALRKRIVLFCTNKKGEILFVRDKRRPSRYILPELFWDKGKIAAHYSNSKAAARLMHEIGLLGSIYQKLSKYSDQLGNVRLHAYHVLVVDQSRNGRALSNGGFFAITYKANDRLWMTPEIANNLLEGTILREMYGMIRTRDYREEIDKLLAVYRKVRMDKLEKRRGGGRTNDFDMEDYSDIEDIYNVLKNLEIN